MAEGGDPLRQARSTAGAAVLEGINVFTVMEDISDKLKILNYEKDFCKEKDKSPLPRTYFALPGKASDQFPYFAAICAWLLSEMNVSYLKWEEFDDPNSISTAIMDALKKLGFNADFPVSKLRHGSGDAVCQALTYLLDQKLKQDRFVVKAPVYMTADSAEEAPVDDVAEVEDDDGIEEDMADDDDVMFQEDMYFQKPDEKTEEEKVTQEILEAKVDPKEWKLELERVGPRLKFRAQPASKEWRTHLEQSAKHEETINKTFPENKIQLSKIGAQLQKAVQRISSKERNINKEFDNLGDEFKGKQNALDTITERYNELGKNVADLTAGLANKTDEVEMLKSRFSDRNNSMIDDQPLRKIQVALTGLKKEVGGLELRIGVVAQTLLQAKLRMH